MSRKIDVDLRDGLAIYSRFGQVIRALVDGLKKRGGTLDDLWKVFRSQEALNQILDILRSVDINLISLRINWSDEPWNIVTRSVLNNAVAGNFVNIPDGEYLEGVSEHRYMLVDPPKHPLPLSDLIDWCQMNSYVPATALELFNLVLQNETIEERFRGWKILAIVAHGTGTDYYGKCPYVCFGDRWTVGYHDTTARSTTPPKILVRVS